MIVSLEIYEPLLTREGERKTINWINKSKAFNVKKVWKILLLQALKTWNENGEINFNKSINFNDFWLMNWLSGNWLFELDAAWIEKKIQREFPSIQIRAT